VKQRAFISGLLCVAVTALLFMSCNTPPDPKYIKDGTAYGQVKGLFRERWWNFYERGASFSEGGFWQEAVADFQEALKQRDRDQRRARTYGMHFTDYFPHRDLGVAYYNLGKFEEAQKELELSLSQAETGKAKHYLNEVRRALLKQAGTVAAPPAVSIGSMQDSQVTNSFKIKVAGEVQSDAYASAVAINDEAQFVELADKRLAFSQEIKLKKGINEIRIKSTDLLGKVSEKKMAVYGDFEGPLMNVKNFSDGQQVGQNKIVLNGTLADSTGVAKLQINEQVLAYNKEKQLDFSFTVQLKEGPNKIMLAATDTVGNTTSGQMNIIYVPRLARGKQAPETPSWLREPIRVALKGSGISDVGSPYMVAKAGPQQLGANFRLDLKDLTETQTVFYENMYIDGTVSGVNDIKSVKINGSPLFVIPGRNIFFNQLVDLKEGENKIVLEVQDTAGATESKTVTINRQVPKVHQIGARMSIAIMPFEKTGEPTSSADIIYDNLVNSFADQGRFHIVSRGAELEAAMREMKLSQSDLVDKGRALQVGKMVAAEGILMGTIRETKDGIEVYARLVNTETSALFDSKDVYGADKSLPQIQYLTNGLALKFKHSFPLLEGMVVKVSGRDIYADFGTAQKIKKDMKFIVFREGEKIVHPVTGKVLGSESQELGIATVVNVTDDMSIGKLVADFDPSKIKVKDFIITK
jgi:TolB-like protein/tetratricopeptide (TPR) repeat protein